MVATRCLAVVLVFDLFFVFHQHHVIACLFIAIVVARATDHLHLVIIRASLSSA